MIKFVRLQKTVIVTVDGKSYPISNSHPLYDKVLGAIDRNELEEIQALVEHDQREDFRARLKMRKKR